MTEHGLVSRTGRRPKCHKPQFASNLSITHRILLIDVNFGNFARIVVVDTCMSFVLRFGLCANLRGFCTISESNFTAIFRFEGAEKIPHGFWNPYFPLGSPMTRTEFGRSETVPENFRTRSGPVMTCWALAPTGVSSMSINNNNL